MSADVRITRVPGIMEESNISGKIAWIIVGKSRLHGMVRTTAGNPQNAVSCEVENMYPSEATTAEAYIQPMSGSGFTLGGGLGV